MSETMLVTSSLPAGSSGIGGFCGSRYETAKSGPHGSLGDGRQQSAYVYRGRRASSSGVMEDHTSATGSAVDSQCSMEEDTWQDADHTTDDEIRRAYVMPARQVRWSLTPSVQEQEPIPVVQMVPPDTQARRWTASTIALPPGVANVRDVGAPRKASKAKGDHAITAPRKRSASTSQNCNDKTAVCGYEARDQPRLTVGSAEIQRPTRRRFTIYGPNGAMMDSSTSCESNIDNREDVSENLLAGGVANTTRPQCPSWGQPNCAQVNIANVFHGGLSLLPGETLSYTVEKCVLRIRLGNNFVRGRGTLYATDRRAVFISAGESVYLDGKTQLSTLTFALSDLPKKFLIGLPSWMRPKKGKGVSGVFPWRGEKMKYQVALGNLSGK